MGHEGKLILTCKFIRSAETQFDAVVEGRLRRKIDFFLVPGVSLLFMFSFIDRTNIGTCPSLTRGVKTGCLLRKLALG